MFTRYCDSGKDKDTIVFKIDASVNKIEVKYWELHEMIMGQMKNFIFMENGVKDLVMDLHRDVKTSPSKLFITGEGSNIPEICVFFEKRLNIKSEIRTWPSPDGKSSIPGTVYGMAQDISINAGAGDFMITNRDKQKFNL